MANKGTNSAGISDRALEMIMRDVMDSLTEWSMESAASGSCIEFEIIDIEPARIKYRGAGKAGTNAKIGNRLPGDIIEFPSKRRAWG